MTVSPLNPSNGFSTREFDGLLVKRRSRNSAAEGGRDQAQWGIRPDRGIDMIEEIVTGLLGGVCRILGWLLVDGLFRVVFFILGYAILKIISWGKYPETNDSGFWDMDPEKGFYVSVVGALATISIIALYYNFF